MGVAHARIRRCLSGLCAVERGPFQGRSGSTTLHLPPVRDAYGGLAFGVWPPAAFTAALRPQSAQFTAAVMLASEPLQQFLAHVGRDPRLQVRVQEAVTADEVALLAQELGYAVSGSDLLRLDGQITGGVRITRVDHPGEYPGRYV